MEHDSLCNMEIGLCDRPICVRVSRLWEYKGGVHFGPIKLLHMVLSDKKGNHMSVLVPTHVVDSCIGVLHEGLVCTLEHYIVAPRQIILNMINAPLMLVFRQSTNIRRLYISEDDFPKWTYNLTALSELPEPNDTPTYFVAIGRIHKRCVTLSNLDGHEIIITLWGEAADQFKGDVIFSLGQENPIAAIFVGTTVRDYGDSRQLAGNSACRWYINENIHDLNAFRSSFRGSFKPVISLPAPHESILQQQVALPVRRVPLTCLLNFNFFEKQDSQFQCTARIVGLVPRSDWWVTYCTRCGRLSRPDTRSSAQPNVYRCSRFKCPSKEATLLYRLCLLGRDGTGEAEFVVHGNVAESMVNHSLCDVIRRANDDASSAINLHICASKIRHIPDEIDRVSSSVCRFIVNISANSFHGKWPSFLVSSIESFSHVPMTCPAAGALVIS